MSRKSPYVIELSQEERRTLEERAAKYTLPYRDVVRARIVLMAAEGLRNDEIAARLSTRREVVSKWRKRFAERRLAGLEELPRRGRPAVFPPQTIVEVKAIACELPATLGLPFSRLSVADIRAAAIERGVVAEVSGTTIWRWLHADAIRPWCHRSWIFPRDPDFEPKAARVLDLYARTWEGSTLGSDEYVLSADEKTQLQALARRHPGRPPQPGACRRVEHEYRRCGTLAYLAAWDVHQARLFGRVESTTGIAPFGRLVDQVMSLEPYCSARQVFWIVDNGSSHRGRASVERLARAYPNLVLVHLPIHASWLNQVEIYFSVLQRTPRPPGRVPRALHRCPLRGDAGAGLPGRPHHPAQLHPTLSRTPPGTGGPLRDAAGPADPSGLGPPRHPRPRRRSHASLPLRVRPRVLPGPTSTPRW
ncbi:MAG: IS630 family transposase [Actinobacteria bacterium]|nr:IS630 family transposase [Actinomycetota bacterium]